jgi:hypothetical protein
MRRLMDIVVEARRRAPTHGQQDWDWLLEELAKHAQDEHDVLKQIAKDAMLAVSDPNLPAQDYRAALVKVCNHALSAFDPSL